MRAETLVYLVLSHAGWRWTGKIQDFQDLQDFQDFQNWRGHEFIHFSAVMLSETLVHLVLSHAGWL